MKRSFNVLAKCLLTALASLTLVACPQYLTGLPKAPSRPTPHPVVISPTPSTGATPNLTDIPTSQTVHVYPLVVRRVTQNGFDTTWLMLYGPVPPGNDSLFGETPTKMVRIGEFEAKLTGTKNTTFAEGDWVVLSYTGDRANWQKEILKQDKTFMDQGHKMTAAEMNGVKQTYGTPEAAWRSLYKLTP